MDQAMNEYLANIEARDRREQAQKGIIDLYARIALRLSAAEERSSQTQTEAAAASPIASPTGKPSGGKAVSSADVVSLRASLASAQTARTALEAEVAALASLKATNAAQAALLDARSRDIARLQRQIRDRNEEIKEGKKLIEQVQDEMVSLNLQLNMAEQRSDRLVVENRELVDRWVKKMGEEVDRMNEESKW